MRRPFGGSCTTRCRSSRVRHIAAGKSQLMIGWVGNIRVFARVRPALGKSSFRDKRSSLMRDSAHESDSPDALADIAYGDERTAQETGQSQITVTNKTESATGKEREQVTNFTFDKVWTESSICNL